MNEDLLKWLASCNTDPVGFVMGAFPWEEEGTQLERFSGPEPWQLEVLEDIKAGLLTPNQAIQLATASGHGVGKSALVCWIIEWAFSTAPDTRGVVTANTEPQLKGKTWAELGKWHNLFIGREAFTLTATALFAKDPEHERTWRIDMVPWSANRPESFAGLHNQGRRILVIFDEASAIDDVIWETTEGALTDADTEIIWCVFGNPTRNSGRFKECFPGGAHSRPWACRQVDSRTISFTNKTQISNWIEAYGDDSDFVRIRVKGVFPRHGEMEFFSAVEVEAAMVREVTTQLIDPLALGVDVARFGANNSVIYPRKGRDARTLPRKVFNGINTVELATKVFEVSDELHADGIFVDGGGVGGGVVDNIRAQHLFCYEVQFGGKSDFDGYLTGNTGERYANKRAEMYGACRAWLRTGAIPNDPELKAQFASITYTFNSRDEIILTSKEQMMKDGLPSPDDLDGLVLTFAYPLSPHAFAGGDHPQKPSVEHEYNPFDEKWMAAA